MGYQYNFCYNDFKEGYEINDEKDKTNTSIEIDNKPKKSNKKKMILIIGLVVLLIIISFLCGLSMMKYLLK